MFDLSNGQHTPERIRRNVISNIYLGDLRILRHSLYLLYSLEIRKSSTSYI